MNFSRIILVFVTATILFVVFGHAQKGASNDAWRWVHFGPETGLPSVPIEMVAEDKDSIIWVSTANNLMWFDGYQWNQIDSTKGLPSLECRRMFPGEEHGIVLQMNDRGVYQGSRNGFRKIVSDVDEFIPLAGHSLLIREADRLLLYENGKKRLLAEHPPLDSNLVEKYLWITGSGNAYMNTLNGLYLWDNGTWNRKIKTIGQYFQISNLIETSDHSLLFSIITPGERLGIWEASVSNEMRFRNSCEYYSKMAFDSNGGRNVYAISLGSEIEIHNGNQLSEKIKLPVEGLRILDLCYAHNGDLWVGTSEGLYCYHSRSTRWIPMGRQDGKNEYVHELIRARDGRLWAGTTHGVDIYSGNKVVQSISSIDGTQLKTVTGLIEDNDGNIWISSGSTFFGAFRWDGSTWKHFDVDGPGNKVFIHKIRKDRQGRLWFLGVGAYFTYGKQPGAFMYSGGKFQQWGERQGLLFGRVYSFAESEDGGLWFGTLNELSCWKNGKWTHWACRKDIDIALIFTIAVDHENNVWFADRYSKVGCYHPNGLFTYYTARSELPDSVVWDIQVDSAGVVWFATEKGLAAYNHGVWTTYDSRSGLVKFPIWPVLPLGKEVFLGTLGNGVICLHPDECEQPPPKIIVENPIVEGDGVLLRWSPIAFQGEPSQANIPTRYRINREQWSSWGTTHEVMLHRLSPGSYFYQIQAKNLIGRVDSAGQLGVFTISPPLFYRPAFLLPVGLLSLGLFLFGFSYVLSIKKRDAALRISEAKFRKLTESTFDGVLIHDEGKILDANDRLALMFGYAPSDFLRKDLSELIAEDFRSFTGKGNIQKPVETWGLRKDGSKVWIEYVEQEIPYGKIKARIAAIRNITERKQSEERLGRYREGLKALALQLSSTEERERREVATYLHDYISQALGFCKMKLGTMKGEVSEKDILEVRGYIEDMFEKTQSLTFELSPPILYELGLEAAIGSLADRMQAQYDLRINYDSSDQPIALNEKISLFLFYSIRELLINVVKHADASEANIRILREDNTLRISVMDNGKGFSASKGKIRQKEEGGFGLFNIQERLTHFGGRMDIVPHPDRGTIVTLMVPLERRRAEQEGKSN
jgi:PAS domain S-box-containing protein